MLIHTDDDGVTLDPSRPAPTQCHPCEGRPRTRPTRPLNLFPGSVEPTSQDPRRTSSTVTKPVESKQEVHFNQNSESEGSLTWRKVGSEQDGRGV